MADIRRMKVCLNGDRAPGDHPGLPTDPAGLARAAEAAVAAGAEAVHLHARDAAGRESLAGADIGPAVAAVRAACPGTGVGVSTGLWDHRRRPAGPPCRGGRVDRPGRRRPAGLRVPSTCPRRAGPSSIAALHGAGIEVEAGVWSVADARALAAFRPGDRLARILVEISGGPAETAIDRADQVLAELDRTGAPEPVLLHGEEDACWPLVAHAGALGLPSRIGLEDTLAGPYGEAVTGNAELVRLGLAAWRSAAPRPPGR